METERESFGWEGTWRESEYRKEQYEQYLWACVLSLNQKSKGKLN